MKTLNTVPAGTTITVKKVTAPKDVTRKLENQGISSGADLTVLQTVDAGIVVSNGRQEFNLEKEILSHIVVMPQFKRENDPILLTGCCAGANTDEIFKRIEENTPKS